MATDQMSASEPLLKYAELLLRKGMREEAAAQLQELLRRDPGCARAHYTLAVARMAEGCPEQAADHFRSALELNPGEIKSLNGLGVALEQLGRIEEAALCYRAAVRGEPCYQDAQINLALLLKNHGCLCDAERQLERFMREVVPAVGPS